MPNLIHWRFVHWMFAALCAGICWELPAHAGEPIDFSRDVRPILAENCYSCHGFDKSSREADLRIDTREGAIADLGGYAAIDPGNPDQSELITRITTDDPDLLMPPADSHKKQLSEQSVKVLSDWIRQGAGWGKHWAFEPPVAEPFPKTSIHPIDHFVGKRLQAVDRILAPKADVHTLARRLSFDLTGLPPAADDVDGLPKQPTDAEWMAWIDGMLGSPHYGERMAMWWLDGARYSDTDGFQQDATRQNWPWRDWIVQAFNINMPFDEFTVQQFAGDLLPDATIEQQLATCFHRNHMHNGEGGRDREESRVDYVLDRTNTMGTLWLGLTLGCTQCHDHKFDPISQRDYYSLTAYFNSIDEDGNAGDRAKPFLKYRSPYAQQSVDQAEQLVIQTEATLATVKAESQADFQVALNRMVDRAGRSFEPWLNVHPATLRSTEGTQLSLESDEIIRASKSTLAQDDYFVTAAKNDLERVTGVRLEVFADSAHSDGKYSYAESGEFVLTNAKLQVRHSTSSKVDDVALVRVTVSSEGEGKDKKYGKAVGTLDDDPRTGWTTRTKPVEPIQVSVFELQEPLVLADDAELDIVLMQRSLAAGELIGRFRLFLTDQRGAAVRSLDPMPMELLSNSIESHNRETENPFTPADVDADLMAKLHDQFLEDYPPWQAATERNQKAVSQRSDTQKAAGELNVTVLKDRSEPRETHVLVRGIWDQHGDQVAPGVLPTVLAMKSADVPTRLELARWIVARDNPLTARVIVNQIWQLFFGAGLVRTPNDFGLQGESPTHPELLDWLAVDLMEHDWNIKHLIRRIVTSRTYQQDSRVSAELLKLDPQNRLLARGARFRLPSWMIRDASLKHSGLLNPTIGGPPMFAYQPPGVWQDQFMGRFTYQPTIGPGQYRRTLYTFWRRSSAPTFLFDSAMRRSCEVTPRRTNTPLQALTLLNDTTALESARKLAERGLDDPAMDSADQRLIQMFRFVLSRRPTEDEQSVLERQHGRALKYYSSDQQAALTLTSVGQLLPPSIEQASELAAEMLLANMILNLDESITHE